MKNTLSTPGNSLLTGQSKGSNFEAQMKRVFAAFERKPSTMLMVSIETGICPTSSNVQGFTPSTPYYPRLLLNPQILLSHEN